jgi:hypothetical protein
MAASEKGGRVQGSEPSDAAVNEYAILVAGSDGTTKRTLKTAANGSLSTTVSNFPAVQPVSDGGGSLTVDDGGGSLAVDDGGGSLTVDDGGGSLTVDATTLPLPTGAATETTLAAVSTNAGATTDAAVTGDSGGTLAAKLRGLLKVLSSVWDSTNSRLGTKPVDDAVTGSITANGQTISLTLQGNGAGTIDVNSGWTGTIILEASVNGTDWRTYNYVRLDNGFTTSQAAVGVTGIRFFAAGLVGIRWRATSAITGTFTSTIRAGAGSGVIATDVGLALLANAAADTDSAPNTAFLVSNTISPVAMRVYQHVYAGDAALTWPRLRTPTTFKTVGTAANGNTALWTPAAGKKFRLLRYMLTITDNATQAAPGTVTVSLFDGAAGATGQVHDVFVPAVGLVNTGSLYSSGWIDLGNGVLSGVANNTLNVNLSAALTAGNVRVMVAGTEE